MYVPTISPGAAGVQRTPADIPCPIQPLKIQEPHCPPFRMVSLGLCQSAPPTPPPSPATHPTVRQLLERQLAQSGKASPFRESESDRERTGNPTLGCRFQLDVQTYYGSGGQGSAQRGRCLYSEALPRSSAGPCACAQK